MHGLGVLSSPKVVEAFDLSQFRRMVDLGGATGHLAIAACERNPDLRAVVFDLPAVIEVSARLCPIAPSLAQRIEVMAGDFFSDELPEADLFALGRILHDWSEDKIRALLAKIYRRLPAGGAILIAERLLYEDKSGPVSAQLQSLNMLMCTEGKERTLSEYRRLLEDAGFRNVQGRSDRKHPRRRPCHQAMTQIPLSPDLGAVSGLNLGRCNDVIIIESRQPASDGKLLWRVSA